VIDTLVSKYSDHLPLYWQSAILERESGIAISRATMDGWVMLVGELLIPVAAAIRPELLSSSYIQADETPVPVQMHDGRGKNHQAYFWRYGQPGGSIPSSYTSTSDSGISSERTMSRGTSKRKSSRKHLH
jgi:hypothetical protein